MFLGFSDHFCPTLLLVHTTFGPDRLLAPFFSVLCPNFCEPSVTSKTGAGLRDNLLFTSPRLVRDPPLCCVVCRLSQVFALWCVLQFLLRPGQPWSHATQGMESDGHPQRVGADHPRSASEGRPVAKGAAHEARRATEKARHEGRVHEASGRPRAAVAGSQSTPRSHGSRCCRGGGKVGVSHCGVVRGEPTCQTIEGRFASRQSRSKVLPVAERVEACKKFLERAKRRVARAEEVINRAQQRVIYMEEVEEAEKRMLVLQAEAAHPPPSSLPEVGELQRQRTELIRERDFLRQSVSTGVPKEAQGEWFANDIPDVTKDGSATAIASCETLSNSGMCPQ